MKCILAILVAGFALGCSQQPKAAPGATSAEAPLTQKLQGMTPEQRTEYVKTHMNEVTASAGVPNAQPKNP